MNTTLKETMRGVAAALLLAASSSEKAEAARQPDCSPIGSVIADGIASWYGPGFNGQQTANGERYDQNKFTAAHLRFAFASVLHVENMDNGKAVKLRVNDRGPYHAGRILDVSRIAALKLGFLDDGVAHVRIRLCDCKPHHSRKRHSPG